jgi:hypothetical protein
MVRVYMIQRLVGNIAQLQASKRRRTMLIGAVAVVAIGGAIVLTRPGPTHQTLAGGPPTPAPCRPPDCLQTRLVPQKFGTLEEAAKLASFKPALPAQVPAAFKMYEVSLLRYTPMPAVDQTVHNDSITAWYRDAAGHSLIISQGFPAMFGFVASPGSDGDLVSRTPQDAKGTVNLSGGGQAYWLRGQPYSPSSNSQGQSFIPDPTLSKTGGLILAWEVGRFGTGWEVSPDRSQVLTGSPMSYSLASDSLSLSDLVEIANSVTVDLVR